MTRSSEKCSIFTANYESYENSDANKKSAYYLVFKARYIHLRYYNFQCHKSDMTGSMKYNLYNHIRFFWRFPPGKKMLTRAFMGLLSNSKFAFCIYSILAGLRLRFQNSKVKIIDIFKKCKCTIFEYSKILLVPFSLKKQH